MDPLRTNSPVDDFKVLDAPDESIPPHEKVTKEQLELAKIGNSPNWKIIKDYLNNRIDNYKKGLFGEDLTGKDASVIGNRFLAAQTVIQEFEALINEVEMTAKSVEEALKDESK